MHQIIDSRPFSYNIHSALSCVVLPRNVINCATAVRCTTIGGTELKRRGGPLKSGMYIQSWSFRFSIYAGDGEKLSQVSSKE